MWNMAENGVLVKYMVWEHGLPVGFRTCFVWASGPVAVGSTRVFFFSTGFLNWFDSVCIAMDVIRLCCDQLPGVAMLGTGGGGVRKEYPAHAQQFVGLLKGNMNRRASSRAFRALLDSEAGQKIREHDGDDLLTAMQKGPLGEIRVPLRMTALMQMSYDGVG